MGKPIEIVAGACTANLTTLEQDVAKRRDRLPDLTDLSREDLLVLMKCGLDELRVQMCVLLHALNEMERRGWKLSVEKLPEVDQ